MLWIVFYIYISNSFKLDKNTMTEHEFWKPWKERSDTPKSTLNGTSIMD